jgi:hypothetical protein
MTLQPIPSEFPYLGGKFIFFFISVQIHASHQYRGRHIRDRPHRPHKAVIVVNSKKEDHTESAVAISLEQIIPLTQLTGCGRHYSRQLQSLQMSSAKGADSTDLTAVISEGAYHTGPAAVISKRADHLDSKSASVKES